MSGLLQTIETAEGQTFGLIRENGQVEDVTVVAAPTAGGDPPPGFVFELAATGPAVDSEESSAAATIPGSPYAPGVGFLLACVVGWNAQASPGLFQLSVKLQSSADGGSSWSDVTTAMVVSQSIANNPTFMQASCVGFMSAVGNLVDMQVRYVIFNDSVSAGAVFNVTGQLTAIACIG